MTRAPVVMLHGAFCGPWALGRFAEAFRAAGHKVHVPALRHHEGGTPPEALASTSLADYAADLEAFIDTLEAKPVLLGHSMGGLLCQILAARRAVKAAILLAPAAPWGVPPSTLFEIASAQTMLLNVGFWDKILMPDEAVAGRNSLDRLTPDERASVFARFVPESGRAIFEMMHWGLDMRRASEVEARKVTCPVLVIAGAEDRISPPGTVERIAALYGSRAAYVKFPRLSHWLIGEPGWEEVAARSLDWLKTI